VRIGEWSSAILDRNLGCRKIIDRNNILYHLMKFIHRYLLSCTGMVYNPYLVEDTKHLVRTELENLIPIVRILHA